MAETSRAWSPYRYAYNNPLRFIDPDGRKEKKSTVDTMLELGGSWKNTGSGFSNGVTTLDYDNPAYYSFSLETDKIDAILGYPFELGINGVFAQAAFDLLKKSMAGQLNLDFKNGIVTGNAIEGAVLSEAATWLLEAIKNPKIKVNLDTVAGFFFYDPNLKENIYFEGDAFRGSFTYNGKVTATNIISTEAIKGFDFVSGSPIGTGVLHAALEGYIGAKYFPNAQPAIKGNNIAYDVSHDWAACLDRENYKDTPSNYRLNLNGAKVNGVLKTTSPYIYDKSTGKILYNFGMFKY